MTPWIATVSTVDREAVSTHVLGVSTVSTRLIRMFLNDEGLSNGELRSPTARHPTDGRQLGADTEHRAVGLSLTCGWLHSGGDEGRGAETERPRLAPSNRRWRRRMVSWTRKFSAGTTVKVRRSRASSDRPRPDNVIEEEEKARRPTGKTISHGLSRPGQPRCGNNDTATDVAATAVMVATTTRGGHSGVGLVTSTYSTRTLWPATPSECQRNGKVYETSVHHGGAREHHVLQCGVCYPGTVSYVHVKAVPSRRTRRRLTARHHPSVNGDANRGWAVRMAALETVSPRAPGSLADGLKSRSR